MSKPSWKYNPEADGGISTANQEASASATAQEQADDTVFQNDYAWIVECLKIQRQTVKTREKFHAWFCQVLNRGPMLATDQALDDFRSKWGDGAAYRAAARALEMN